MRNNVRIRQLVWRANPTVGEPLCITHVLSDRGLAQLIPSVEETGDKSNVGDNAILRRALYNDVGILEGWLQRRRIYRLFQAQYSVVIEREERRETQQNVLTVSKA